MPWSVFIKKRQSERSKKRLQLCVWSFLIAIGLLCMAYVFQGQVKSTAIGDQEGADASIALYCLT
jgi:hypothetical protein